MVSLARDLVAAADDLPHQLGHLIGEPADHEERGPGPRLLEQIERRREKKATAYDLRPLILGLEVRGSDGSGVTLAMRLRHASDAVGRPEEVVAALGEPPAAPLPVPLAVRSIVRERIVMADDTAAPAAAVPALAAPIAAVPAPVASSAE